MIMETDSILQLCNLIEPQGGAGPKVFKNRLIASGLYNEIARQKLVGRKSGQEQVADFKSKNQEAVAMVSDLLKN